MLFIYLFTIFFAAFHGVRLVYVLRFVFLWAQAPCTSTPLLHRHSVRHRIAPQPSIAHSMFTLTQISSSQTLHPGSHSLSQVSRWPTASPHSPSHAHFIRTSGGKGTGRMGRWGSMRGSRSGTLSGGGVGGTLGTLRHYPTSTPALRSSISTGPRLSVDSSDTGSEAVQSIHKAALYVFGEKTQIKVCICCEKQYLFIISQSFHLQVLHYCLLQ